MICEVTGISYLIMEYVEGINLRVWINSKRQEGTLTLDTVIHDFGPGNDGTFGVLQETVDKLDLNANLQERMELDEFYAQYNVPIEEVYPNVIFTEEEIDEISVLQTDIDSYVLQKYAQWIVDGGVDAEWDSFQQQLKNMGVERYIEIYQQACDRYYSQN